MTQYIAQWASGIVVRWRALTWGEYRQFKERTFTRPMGVAADIYRAVLLDGPDVDHCPAGVAAVIANLLLSESPFSGHYPTVVRHLEESRQRMGRQYLLSAKAMVAHLFHYSFEEIDGWDPETFFQRLAQAEFIAGRTIEPADPKADKKGPQQRPAARPLDPAQAMVLDRVRNRA